MMILRLIRERGWSVGAHNDYTMNGIPMTYWLFTGPDDRYIKVEGPTAIEQDLLDSVLGQL